MKTLTLFSGRVTQAAAQFSTAVLATRTERLMEKDQDPAWLATLVLDVVGGFLLTKFASGLLKLRDGLSAELAANAVGTEARTALLKVTKKNFETVLKPAIDASKKAAVSAWNGQDLTKRAFMTQYLDMLADQGGLGFAQIRDVGPVGATDAELVALAHAFDPNEHMYMQYKAAIEEKLNRLEKSGLLTIGSSRNETHREPVTGGGETRTPVRRHTRVTWLTFTSGRTPQLAFEQQDVYGVSIPEKALYGNFGEQGWHFANEVTGYVPSEFVDVAISRHIAIWGRPPLTIVVDDGWWKAQGRLPAGSRAPNKAGLPDPSPAAAASKVGAGKDSVLDEDASPLSWKSLKF